MNIAERTAQLERKLTGLLGKSSYIRTKRPCRGKYRGKYDYGLDFGDGTNLFISLGKTYYLDRLTEKVEMYQYFHDNREYLTRRTNEVIERDNRQALTLGLSPVTLESVCLQTHKAAANTFWVGFRYRHEKGIHWHTDTEYYYTCRGCAFNDEKSVDVYFDALVNRPDEKLGRIKELGEKRFSKILLGHLRE